MYGGESVLIPFPGVAVIIIVKAAVDSKDWVIGRPDTTQN